MFGNQPIDLLRTRAQSTPDRTAVVDTETETELSYRELDRAVEEFAAGLARIHESGATPRVAVALSPRIETVCAVHAALRLGWTLGMCNTRLATGELADRLDRFDTTLIICGSETEQQMAETVSAMPQSADVSLRTVDEPETDAVEPVPTVNESVEATPNAPDETALVLFTSGTTGDPKGVKLTPGNLIASAIASAFRLGVSPADRWLCCLPTYHMGGLAPVFRCTIYGTTLVLQREFEAVETSEIITEQEITGVSLVPTQLSRLLDAGLDSTGLGTVLLGGAPASESLLDRAAASGVPVYPTYGLTETASQVATARPADYRTNPGTVGQPLFGTNVQIVDDENRAVDAGERGEIVVDGPTVTPGYLDDEQTQNTFSGLGLHTGDLGYRDEDGRLWILGRLDDTVITGGELVAPATVTEQITAVPGVADAAVVGINDEEWGEVVSALIVSSDGSDDLEARVLEHCERTLADYEVPKRVEIVEELPRTQSGTVDRQQARDLIRRTSG